MSCCEEVEKLVDAQDMETAVHERAHAFLDQRIKHLYDENIAWTKDTQNMNSLKTHLDNPKPSLRSAMSCAKPRESLERTVRTTRRRWTTAPWSWTCSKSAVPQHTRSWPSSRSGAASRQTPTRQAHHDSPHRASRMLSPSIR